MRIPPSRPECAKGAATCSDADRRQRQPQHMVKDLRSWVSTNLCDPTLALRTCVCVYFGVDGLVGRCRSFDVFAEQQLQMHATGK